MSVQIESIQVGPLGENVYIVQSGDTTFIVDPGDEAEKILRFLQTIETTPQFIVLTHGHLDHSSGLPYLLTQWKGALPRIAIHSLDAAYLGAAGEATNRKLFEGLRAMPYFRHAWKDLPEPDLLLAEGDSIPGTNFSVLHTPATAPDPFASTVRTMQFLSRGTPCSETAWAEPTDPTPITGPCAKVFRNFPGFRRKPGYTQATDHQRQSAESWAAQYSPSERTIL